VSVREVLAGWLAVLAAVSLSYSTAEAAARPKLKVAVKPAVVAPGAAVAG
jgi:hypothetical protein